VIKVKLKDAVDAYERRVGTKLTYGALAERTGLARATIESVATRPSYNATLDVIDRLCQALECSPGDLLERTD
jgi:DNA-binding Xre family transcriptional regulator